MSRFTRTKSNKTIFVGRGLLGKIRFGSLVFNILIIGLIFSAMIFYLAQTNMTATYGFKMRELEKKIADLKQENKDLELKAAELQSITQIEEVGKKLNMVKIARIDYIKSGEASMAAR